MNLADFVAVSGILFLCTTSGILVGYSLGWQSHENTALVAQLDHIEEHLCPPPCIGVVPAVQLFDWAALEMD